MTMFAGALKWRLVRINIRTKGKFCQMSTYTGTITTTGKSEAIRLEKALFKSHPEFRQKSKVHAHVIGPGTMSRW